MDWVSKKLLNAVSTEYIAWGVDGMSTEYQCGASMEHLDRMSTAYVEWGEEVESMACMDDES